MVLSCKAQLRWYKHVLFREWYRNNILKAHSSALNVCGKFDSSKDVHMKVIFVEK